MVDVPAPVEVPPPKKPYPPQKAFFGAVADLADGSEDWDDFAEKLRGHGISFIDFETTGLDDGNVPVQIGAIKVEKGKKKRFNVFVNPDRPLSEWSKKNLKDADGNPLTDEWLGEQATREEALGQLLDFLGDDIIAAHNLKYDWDQVLRPELEAHGIEYTPGGALDTLELARQVIPKEESKSHKLGDLLEFFGDKATNWHSADADAEDASKVLDGVVAHAKRKDVNPNILKKTAQETRFADAQEKFDSDMKKYEEERRAYDEAVRAGEELAPLAPDPDLGSGEFADDYPDPFDLINWDMTEFEGMEDDYYEFVDEAVNDWGQWNKCRDIRRAAYDLAGLKPGDADPNINRTGGYFGAGWERAPDEDLSREQARFFMASMAKQASGKYRDDEPLFRAMDFANEDEKRDFWSAMQPGAEVDVPLLAFADRRGQGPNEFLSKFGNDALLQVEPGSVSVSAGHFDPLYSEADELSTTDRIRENLEEYATWRTDDGEDDSDVQDVLQLLERYEKSRNTQADDREQLREELQQALGDFVEPDEPWRWAGDKIEEEDNEYFYESVDNPEGNTENVSFEKIAGGRFEVVSIEPDPKGTYGTVVTLRQKGVFDPGSGRIIRVDRRPR